MQLVTATPAPSIPLDSKFSTQQSIPSWSMQDVVLRGSWALPSRCSAAVLQEGTEQRISLMGQALIFPVAAVSDSPFLSHSSWHCHTYLTALNPPLSLYQSIKNSSTVICLGQNNFLRRAVIHSSFSYCCLTGNHLTLFCSWMSVEQQSPFPSLQQT